MKNPFQKRPFLENLLEEVISELNQLERAILIQRLKIEKDSHELSRMRNQQRILSEYQATLLNTKP